jgi:hypothetical protein
VIEGTPLIVVNTDDGDALKLAGRIVSVRGLEKSLPKLDLSRLASELHDEAIQAIRGSRLAAYDDIADAQAALVLAIPEAWARDFGQRYTNDLASGVFPLSLGPIDRVRRNIYEQVSAALSAGVREVALTAAYQPIAIATRAADVGAAGLVIEMMRVSRGLAMLSQTGELADLVRDHMWINFSSLLQFTICPPVEDDSDTEDRRRQFAELVQYALAVMADMAKDAIEARDTAMFEQVDRGWGHVLEFWVDEQAADYRPESLDRELAVAVQQSRERYRFSVACWLAHRLLAEPANPKLLAMFERVRTRYASADEITAVAANVCSADDRGPLSEWLMSDLPDGEVHLIDSLTPLLRCTGLLLLASDPQEEHQLRPSPWLLAKREALLGAVEVLANCDAVKDLLSTTVDDVGAAALAAKDSISAAADSQAEANDNALIAATISDEVQERFCSLVAESWNSGRSMLGIVLTAGGSHVHDRGTAPPERLGPKPTLELKMWAVDHSDQPGFEQVAKRYGRALARGENRQLVGWLASAARAESSGDAAHEPVDVTPSNGHLERARRAVVQMRREGYQPSLIVHGRSWDLLQSFAAEPLEDGLQVDSRAQGLRGRWDGLLIAETALLDENVIVVLDTAAWGGVREWSEAAGGGLIATLTTYTAETARELLRAHPDLLGVDLSESQKIRELQRRMLVTVSVSTEVQIKDPLAARVVPI